MLRDDLNIRDNSKTKVLPKLLGVINLFPMGLSPVVVLSIGPSYGGQDAFVFIYAYPAFLPNGTQNTFENISFPSSTLSQQYPCEVGQAVTDPKPPSKLLW